MAAGLGGYLIAEDTGGGGAGGGEATVAVVPMSPSVGGTLAVGDVSSMLNLHGLRQLTGREVYQVWVAHGTSVRPSSNFIPDSSGDATTAVDGHLGKGTKVMVTREPHPGRTTPTPPVLLTATVSRRRAPDRPLNYAGGPWRHPPRPARPATGTRAAKPASPARIAGARSARSA